MSMEPPDWLFQNITEASRRASRVHAFYIGFVFFCALTLLGTSDRQIILDEQTQLPLISRNVSFTGFCLATAIMAIAIFAYFQVYLQKLRSLTLKLKSDYLTVVPQRIYPWMVSIAEEYQHGTVGFLQRLIVELSVWYLLPIILSIIPYWLVRAHRPVDSYFSAFAPIVGIWLVIVYRSRYERTVFWRLFKAKKVLALFTILIVAWSLFLMCFCIPWTMRGHTFYFKRGTLPSIRRSTYVDLMISLGSWWCVDLSRQNLVKKPETDSPRTYWLELRGSHMEGANLTGSNLKRANLEDAHLQHALMFGTSLEGAFLGGANLSSALAPYSNFEDATFFLSNLESADLARGNFRNAKFGQSDLIGVNLDKSNMEGADLYNCKLLEARFWGANLQNANLRMAKFQGACLTRAKLQNAEMGSTELDGAYLFRADLRGAKNLKVEQVCKAASLWGAQIDENLANQIQARCPLLLIKPEKEPTAGIFGCDPDAVVIYP
jgi:uncharacterized protein YjbI with pentapeptide repeats